LKRAKQPSPIKQGVYEPSSALVREFAERGCEAKLIPVSVNDTGTFFRVGAKDKRFHLTANMALDKIGKQRKANYTQTRAMGDYR